MLLTIFKINLLKRRQEKKEAHRDGLELPTSGLLNSGALTNCATEAHADYDSFFYKYITIEGMDIKCKQRNLRMQNASRTRNGMPVNEAKESQSCVAFSLSRARAARWLNYSSVAIDIARELRCAASETTVPWPTTAAALWSEMISCVSARETALPKISTYLYINADSQGRQIIFISQIITNSKRLLVIVIMSHSWWWWPF